MNSQPTIFAVSSGTGRAGVAVIRLSGPGSGSAIEALAGPLPRPRFAAFRRLRDRDGVVFDDALVLWFPGPRSETGEDMAEFQVHGSRAVIQTVFAILGGLPNFRPAEPGEFVRRGFINGKFDLTVVEGLADLIDAETQAQLRQAVVQAGGGLARLYDGWRDELLTASALVEAAIDFSDEGDVGQRAFEQARGEVLVLRSSIEKHLSGAHRGEIVRTGFRVVLAGPPNAGKSSLLNALARRDVAIVSDEAGTTRDVIEVRLDLKGLPVVVTDTAGLRETADASQIGAIEREGMRRTLLRAADADLVLWVVDGAAPVWEPAASLTSVRERVMTVLNKADLVPCGDCPDPDGDGESGVLKVSAHTGDGLPGLIEAIAARVEAVAGDRAGEPVPTTERHRQGLSEAVTHLEAFLAGDEQQIEMRAEDLRLAARAVGRLTGRIDAEDVLSVIFGRFCIGK